MGIADSRGVIYDFAGPYTIGVDDMAFGRPTRYLQLDPARCSDEHWDEAVARASEIYRWVVLRASRVFVIREAYGQTNRRIDGQTDRQAGRETREVDRQTHTIGRPVDRWIYRQTGNHTGRQTRQTSADTTHSCI